MKAFEDKNIRKLTWSRVNQGLTSFQARANFHNWTSCPQKLLTPAVVKSDLEKLLTSLNRVKSIIFLIHISEMFFFCTSLVKSLTFHSLVFAFAQFVKLYDDKLSLSNCGIFNFFWQKCILPTFPWKVKSWLIFTFLQK